MQLDSIGHDASECDGCGVPAPESTPTGWYSRPVDPPFYTGPRQLLFCPECHRRLPVRQQPRWRRLGAAPAERPLPMAVRRLLHVRSAPRRGPVV